MATVRPRLGFPGISYEYTCFAPVVSLRSVVPPTGAYIRTSKSPQTCGIHESGLGLSVPACPEGSLRSSLRGRLWTSHSAPKLTPEELCGQGTARNKPVRVMTPGGSSPRTSALRDISIFQDSASRQLNIATSKNHIHLDYTLSETSYARLRHRQKNEDALPQPQDHSNDGEYQTRSEMMKARWRDPAWRAAMLAKRNTPEALRKRAEVARKLWQDPAYRERMRDSRLGRPAPNKGISPSNITRLRMSFSRRGVKKTEETRRRMSDGKLNRPADDSWPKRIAESKKGKTREYFQLLREFRALHKDLKLWSDSYRAQYGLVPRESTFESRVAAPMLTIKIKRYLMLKKTGGFENERGVGAYEIITTD